MNKPAKLVTIVAAVVGLFASGAAGQRNYNPKTVETLQGKVLSVEKTSPPAQRGHGVHLMLQTDKETIEVHLGPAGYLEKQAMQIAANDAITVTGSRVMMDGKPAIIAGQIKKGDEVLKLRDENGVPAWSAGRRGR
ncbi:MAG: hypothetical protein WCE51_02235 [Chthoniobacterales bacterium]